MLALLCLIAIAPSSATAEWLFRKVGGDDPFKGGQQYSVGVIERGSDISVLLGCRSGAGFDLSVMTESKSYHENVDATRAASGHKASLQFVVDDQPKRTLPAIVSAPKHGEIAVYSAHADVVDIARMAASAGRRFAVAIVWAADDRVGWSHAFDVRGASTAMKALLEACKPPGG